MKYAVVDYSGDVVNRFSTHWEAVTLISAIAREWGNDYVNEMQLEIIQEDDEDGEVQN